MALLEEFGLFADCEPKVAAQNPKTKSRTIVDSASFVMILPMVNVSPAMIVQDRFGCLKIINRPQLGVLRALIRGTCTFTSDPQAGRPCHSVLEFVRSKIHIER